MKGQRNNLSIAYEQDGWVYLVIGSKWVCMHAGLLLPAPYIN